MGNGIFLASFWYVFRASNKYLETHTQSPLSGVRASVFLSFRSTETDSFQGCIYFIYRLHAYGKFERFKVPLGLDIEHRAHAVLLDAGATSEKYCLTSQTLSDWDYVLGRFCIELSRIQFVDYKKKTSPAAYDEAYWILWQEIKRTPANTQPAKRLRAAKAGAPC